MTEAIIQIRLQFIKNEGDLLKKSEKALLKKWDKLLQKMLVLEEHYRYES